MGEKVLCNTVVSNVSSDSGPVEELERLSKIRVRLGRVGVCAMNFESKYHLFNLDHCVIAQRYTYITPYSLLS